MLWFFLALGAAVRLATLSWQSMWFDEIRTLYIAEQQRLTPNLPHVGFFAIERLFFALPLPPDVSLRLFPALCGVAGIALVYAIGRRLAGCATGRWAAGLVVLNAFHVFYSQEARFYMPMFALTAASWLMTIRLFASGRLGWLLGALAADAAAVFMQPTQLAYMVLHLGWLTGAGALSPAGRRLCVEKLHPWRRAAMGGRRFAPASAGRLVVLVAMGAAGVAEFGRYASLLSRFAWSPARLLARMEWPFWAEHIQYYGAQFRPGLSPGGIYAWLFVAVAAAGVALGLARWRRDAVFGLVVVAGGLLLGQAYDTGHVYETKYIFFIFPFCAVFAAAGLDALSGLLGRWLEDRGMREHRARAAGVALPALLAGAFTLWALGQYFALGKINEKAAVRWVGDRLRPGDCVATYGHSTIPVWLYWNMDKMPPDQYRGVPWQYRDDGHLLRGQLRALARRYGRVWFID
ncbi:MAG: glycosyltransferase family 39 protein, partial [bacterium]|nr:glycosyltransferase family 39 protein [bacterium]